MAEQKLHIKSVCLLCPLSEATTDNIVYVFKSFKIAFNFY